jgi:hypothetical protein
MTIVPASQCAPVPGRRQERLLVAVVAGNHTVAAPREEEIRAALERITSSSGFLASPQLASFLRFVVDETLGGNAERLKGYTVAIGALGRSDAFDPQDSPIVRVEAARLRRALEHYYAGPGRDDDVVIELPVGGYIPTFARREHHLGPTQQPVPSRGLLGIRGRRSRLVVFVACVAVAASKILDLIIGAATRIIIGHAAPGSAFAGSYGVAVGVSSAFLLVCVVIAWRISQD